MPDVPLKVQALSLFGQPLHAEQLLKDADTIALEADVERARTAYKASPDDPALFTAHADALTTLGRYQEAVTLYTLGMKSWPEEARLYVQRGHRYINMRLFDRAVEDLQHARKLGADDFAVWYHLGLAAWMTGDWEAAHSAFVKCYAAAPRDSEKAAITDWLYMCLRRLGRQDEADALLEPIHADMVMTGNNKNYLNRLLFYKGQLSEDQLVASCRPGTLDFATVGFGLGCWHLQAGNHDRAMDYLEKAADSDHWPAWGVVAAENELFRERGNSSDENATPEAFGLLGQPLYRQDMLDEANRQAMATRRQEAEQALAAAPDDVEAFITYVKTVDGAHEYREAIKLYSEGLERWPEEAMLYCHRGHRYINTRQFDLAIADLEHANRLRPGTFDMLYHLGLAHYMKGDFEQALTALEECDTVTVDSADVPASSALRLVAPANIIRIGVVDWIFMTLSRLGRFDEAAATLDTLDLDVKAGGNMIFYQNRVSFYKGLLTEEQLLERFSAGGVGPQTMGYALGNWHFCRGDRTKALNYFLSTVAGSMWAAFGNVAAEADLAREWA